MAQFSLMPVQARRESTSDLVYTALREAIVNRELEPGERVTEAGLAEQLHVSKTPVREALLRLEHVGLVEPDTRRGGRVARPSAEAIRTAYEVRIALECEAARLAAQASLLPHTPNLTSFARADEGSVTRHSRAFHLEIAQMTGNDRLLQMVQDAIDLASALHGPSTSRAEVSSRFEEEHSQIATAVLSHDETAAATLMRNHLVNLASTATEDLPPAQATSG